MSGRVNVAELERVEWPLRRSELSALVAWVRGEIDRDTFANSLRAEDWPLPDVDDLVVLLADVLATEWRPRAEGGTA